MSRISAALHEQVRLAAKDRCGYCLSAQEYVLGQLEVEHIIPTARGGSDDETNLWMACRLCNGYKGLQIDGLDRQTGERIKLFNPRTQAWNEHFRWGEDAAFVEGLTSTGRATVDALQLNNRIAITVRRNWMVAGWHPPK